MKKILFLLFLLVAISLFFISGCIEVEEEPFCSPPYFEYMKGVCCLDQNNNIVCDKDEATKSIQKELKKDVIDETCSFGPGYFNCFDIDATKDPIVGDFIHLTLSFKKRGVAVIEKINIPGLHCSKEFPDWVLADGIQYGKAKDFTLRCDIEDDFDSLVMVDFVFFKEVLVGDEWTGQYNTQNVVVRGQISGDLVEL